MKKIKKNRTKEEQASPVALGIAGGMALLAAYFGILTALNSFSHALDQFSIYGIWILALSAGFGIQVALYTKMKNYCIESGASIPAGIAASGGISGTSMVACCAHHIADFAPLLGVSAAAVFLSKYQTPFMALGLLSNINGTVFMLKTMQKHSVSEKSRLFGSIYKYDLSGAFKIVFIASVILFIAIVFYSA